MTDETAAQADRPSRGAPSRWAVFGRKSPLAGNLAANYLGRAAEAVLSVVFVPLYIHYLGPEAYGVIGLIALLQSFLLLLDFGMTPALTREAARHGAGELPAGDLKDLVRSVELVAGGIALTAVAAVALLAPQIAARWLRASELDADLIAGAIAVGGALIGLRFFETIFRGTLQGLERQVQCNAIVALFALLRAGGSLGVLAWTGWGLRGFLVWQALAALGAVLALRAAVALALPRAGRKPRFSRAALASIGRFAGGMLAVSLVSLAATQADKLVLSRLLPLATFGYYVFAANLAVILELAVTPAMGAVYPRIVALVARGEEAELARFFHRWARIVAMVTAPIAAWLVFFAPEIVHVWSGNPQLSAQSGKLLAIIAIGTFLHAQCALPYYVQLANGWTGLSVWTNALALLVTVPMLVFAVPRFGAQAGAWTWVGVASLYVLVGINTMFGRLLTGERWRFFLGDVGLPAAVAFAAMATMALMPMPQAWFGRVAVLGLALALSFATTAATVWLMERRPPPR